MRQDELLLTILGVTILLNVLLVVASWLRSRSLRASGWREPAAAGSTAGSRKGHAPPPPTESVALRAAPFGHADREDDGRVAAAVEAFVASVSPDAAGSSRTPTPAEVLARREQALGGGPAPLKTVPTSSASSDPVTAGVRLPAGLPGLAAATTWEDLVRDESARAARFGRPSMVVTATLPQLEDVAARWGRDAADRVVAEITRLLESEGRAVDRIALLGDSTFGILLPETSELGASRFTERVRAAADAWLISAGLSVRLEVAWANVPGGGDGVPPTTTPRPRKQKAARR
jgi:diguanylate cyclase (GGDEF)-like protein